jgi:hypothetical protein
MGKLISQQGGVGAPSQSSRQQKTAVGSGARPTPSRIKIPSSAPTDPKGLGRKPPGALA